VAPAFAPTRIQSWRDVNRLREVRRLHCGQSEKGDVNALSASPKRAPIFGMAPASSMRRLRKLQVAPLSSEESSIQ
jgi:hypothetical protein